MTDPVTLDIDHAIAHLALAAPERGNTIDLPMAQCLRSCVDAIATDAAVRAVLLTAQGRNFSFGGDVRHFHQHIDDLDATFRDLFAVLNPAIEHLASLPVPVVSAVQGWCVGGGLGLAALADVVVAGESAKFGTAFAGVGLSNDTGTTAATASRMGVARARRFYLLNETLTAPDALACGLIDQVVPDDGLQDAAGALAERLASGPTVAFAGMKRAFALVGRSSLSEALATEGDNMDASTRTADAAEALSAFVEKRTPHFQGQ